MLEFSINVNWIGWIACLIAGVSLPFGVFTALWPKGSIALYEWLMARINWRVSPIDEAREVRTTRFFGALLILLNLMVLALLWRQRV